MAGRIVFRQTAEDTRGVLLQFDFFLPVGKASAQEHLHPNQEERFEVIAGRVSGRIGKEQFVKGPGEVAVMPPGVPHFWWNDGDVEAHLRVELRPALRSELFYETMASLASGEKGILNPLQAAVVMREYRHEFCILLFHGPVRQWLILVLAAIGRLLGYRAEPRPGGPA